MLGPEWGSYTEKSYSTLLIEEPKAFFYLTDAWDSVGWGLWKNGSRGTPMELELISKS